MTQESRDRERTTLDTFISVYCRAHHGEQVPHGLCRPCRELLDYALQRLARCPHDPKPACRKCTTHCYAGAQRQRIREVMKYSGMHFVKRGRLDWLVRYFL